MNMDFFKTIAFLYESHPYEMWDFFFFDTVVKASYKAPSLFSIQKKE